MSKEDARDIVNNMDDFVDNKFREFVYVFLKNYKDNPTKRKFQHFILNLPIGFILERDDLSALMSNDKAPDYREFVSMLKDNNIIKQKVINGKDGT